MSNAAKDRRNNFLRRTKATAPPDTTDTDTVTTTDTEVTSPASTGKYRRGPSKFKSRKELESERAKSGNRVDVGRPLRDADKRPAPAPRRSERPTRTFVRRRLGGANATTSTTAAPVSSSSVPTRRPFRVASRRRPIPISSTTTTTTEAVETDATTAVASEEYLQDIDDTDVIEDPTLEPPKKVFKIQRRPLINLKDEVTDQNPSATNEDERKRQSKKYSATFKQNQLDAVLRQKAKSQEETTERKTTPFDDFNPETAVAIAAHQLFAAPVPSVPNFEEDTKPTKKSRVTAQYSSNAETESFTDPRKTVYFEDFTSTPVFKSSTQDYIATGPGYTGISPDFDTSKIPPTTSFTIPKSTFSTSTFGKDIRPAVPSPTIINTGLSGVASTSDGLPLSTSTNTGFTRGLAREPSTPEYSSISPLISSTPRFASTKKLIPVPVEDYAFSTGVYSSSSQEPAYFTREYLLESPVTKTYDDEYQYLSPITTPVTTTRKTFRKKIMRKISTTFRPTVATIVSPGTTAKPPPRRVPTKTPKPFEKVKTPSRTYKPIENYDYYDDSNEKVAEKYIEGTKVVVHAKGTIECLDIGNFPHPTSCKKFISCSRMETGALVGWEYVCPKGLSFDPVGGICNWSAGLGCDEKDV